VPATDEPHEPSASGRGQRHAIRLVIPPRFKRDFKKKAPELRAAIAECLDRLASNPRHPGLQTHRVKGTPRTWEAYVDRANRVTFEYGDDRIVMLNHCNHDILKRA
jgi:hypothetical protein